MRARTFTILPLLLPLLLPSHSAAQSVGESGLTLPTFKTNPGMLNCVSHIEMGLHYGCSLVAASLKGLQSQSVYKVVQSDEHYAKRVQRCANEASGLPPPPSDKACEQPGNSLTAPLFAEVAGWDANVSCWGQFDIYGQQVRSMRPPGDIILSYTAVGKGYFGGVTNCGILADGDNKGAVKCYGRAFALDTRELSFAESQDERLVACRERSQAVLALKKYLFQSVQVGGSFACGMAYDSSSSSYDFNRPDTIPYELMCWGDDSSSQCTVPPAPTDYGSLFVIKYIDYSLGFDHVCALRNDNRIVCWGQNIEGQTSIPNTDTVLSKQLGTGVRISSDRDWIAVSAGWSHTCGLKSSGSVVCWGSNNWGQSAVPVGGTVFREVTAGYDSTCALSVERKITCWGRDNRGQSSPVPMMICTQLVSVRNQQLLGNLLQSQRQMRFAPKHKSCTCTGSGCKCDKLNLDVSAAPTSNTGLYSGVLWSCMMLLMLCS